MANNNGGRVCPKCGTFLGQKNVCPICNGPERKNDNAGGNGVDSAQDYVSRVIDFVEKHPDNWDDEFNTFFEQQKNLETCSFKSCYEACARIHEILKSLPNTGRMTGSQTLRAMTGIQEVFPGISEDGALEIVTGLSKRKTDRSADPKDAGRSGPGAHSGNVGSPFAGADEAQIKEYHQLRSNLTGAVRDDFHAVMRTIEELSKYGPLFWNDFLMFYKDMFLKEKCPLAFFSVLMLRPWNRTMIDEVHPPLNLEVINPSSIYVNGENRTGFFRKYACLYQALPSAQGGIGTFWTELVPNDREVLMLYCGKGLEIRNAKYDARHLVIQPSAKPLDLLDGLQCRRREGVGSKTDFMLLYMIKPE